MTIPKENSNDDKKSLKELKGLIKLDHETNSVELKNGLYQ